MFFGTKDKVLLINASPAKFGGAKSIVEKFISTADFNAYDKVYLLAPGSIEIKTDKVRKIDIETSGLSSVLFSVFFVLFYTVKFRATHLVSFNNVNLILPFYNKVTYYHTPHIFYSNSFRHKLLRFIIKNLMNGQKFVFQSDYVLDEFARCFGRGYKFEVNWCGCDVPDLNVTPVNQFNNKMKCIVPIVDSKSDVKNFKFIISNIKSFRNSGVDIIALDSEGELEGDISYIGMQKKTDLLLLYNECDFMVMPSLFETVGLPIFEFASTGKPVLVLDKPYLHGIDKTVGLTSNIILFNEDDFESKLIYLLKNYEKLRIAPLNKNHPLTKPVWYGLL